MQEKDTHVLEDALNKAHLGDYESFVRDNKDSMISDSTSFSTYMKTLFASKKLTQQKVFVMAEIPEKYGYKLLSGEKHTKQRDIILRICYVAEFTLQETQRALRKYGMPELYVKDKRDILLMIAFNERPGNLDDVNAMLHEQGLEELKASGIS